MVVTVVCEVEDGEVGIDVVTVGLVVVVSDGVVEITVVCVL